MKKQLLTIAICVIAWTGFAQNEDDALRYSEVYFGGTARNMSMAGALSALGGDYSNVLTNPAGLARFKKSNFSATVNVENPRAASDYYGSVTNESGLGLNWSNLSYIKAYNLDPNKRNNWYGVTMGMGLNRTRSFHERFTYSGTSDTSIVQSFINQAWGTPDSMLYNTFPFGAGLAWDVYAIDPHPFNPNEYVSGLQAASVNQTREVIRKGGMTEFNFSMSGNYANKLFIGGSLNGTWARYSESFTHVETSNAPDSIWLNGLTYTGDLDVKGWGFNARVGMIFLPVDWMRVGLAVQTPTFFRLGDFWTNNMYTDTDTGPIYEDGEYIPTGNFDYKVRTPFRASGSLGFVLKKLGSIGAEVEYVDYSGANLASRRFSPSPYPFTTENQQIDNLYRPVLNYKVGVEGRITPQFYLRGGFAYYQSPYKANKGVPQYPKMFYTGGFGYNLGKFYVDAAAVFASYQREYYAYDPSLGGSKSTQSFLNAQYVVTFGFRFE